MINSNFDIFKIRNEFIKKTLILFFVSRPIHSIFAYLLFLVGFIYSKTEISLEFYLILFIIFLINHITYGLNDLFDYETDKLNKRKGLLHGLILEKNYHNFVKKSVLISTLIILVINIYYFNYYTKYIIFLFIFLSYSYSIPPIRAKNRFLLDIIYNSVGYFLIVLLGFSMSESINIPFVFYILIPLVAGLSFHTQLFDYEADKKAGLRTTPVIIGKKMSAFFAFMSILGISLFYKFQTQTYNYFMYYLTFLMLILIFITNNYKYLKIHLYILYWSILGIFLYYFFIWIPKYLY